MTRPIAAILAELDQRDLLVDFTAIAKKHHVTIAELMDGKRQLGAASQAKRECWLMLTERDWTYSAIARLWGIDHSSVMHGVRKAKGAAILVELKRGAA